MKILDLYRLHINSDPSGVEIHKFLSLFNLVGAEVKHYDKDLEKLRLKDVAMRNSEAEKWIYKNSKVL